MEATVAVVLVVTAWAISVDQTEIAEDEFRSGKCQEHYRGNQQNMWQPLCVFSPGFLVEAPGLDAYMNKVKVNEWPKY